MSNEVIRLNAGDITLVLMVETGVCEVFLSSSLCSSTILVGHNSFKTMERFFIKAFNPLMGPRHKFTWRGKTMYTVMTFMGPHATMAAEELDNGGLCLNILDLNGDFLPATIDLTRDDMDRWLTILKKYRLKHF